MIGFARTRLRALTSAAVTVLVPLAAISPSAAAEPATDPPAAVKSDDPVGGDPQSPGPVFVLDKGRFFAFDPPGVNANELIDVNGPEQVAGTYVDGAGVSHGFLRDRRGRFTRFDFPGAAATYVLMLNDRGQIVGNACDS